MAIYITTLCFQLNIWLSIKNLFFFIDTVGSNDDDDDDDVDDEVNENNFIGNETIFTDWL